MGAKHIVYNMLAHRAKVVSHNHHSLQKELKHVREALQACHFPSWTHNKLQQKFDQQQHNNTDPSSRNTQPTIKNNNGTNITTTNGNISIVVPYIHGLGERLKRKKQEQGNTSSF